MNVGQTSISYKLTQLLDNTMVRKQSIIPNDTTIGIITGTMRIFERKPMNYQNICILYKAILILVCISCLDYLLLLFVLFYLGFEI